jgi:hypothetical protein
MTARSGLIQPYINTVPDKVMVTDRILMLDPYDIVAYSYLGTDMGKFNFKNLDEISYEWLNDTWNDRTDVLVSGLDSGTTTTTAVITTAALFQAGDVWLADSEQLWVSAMSGTTATVTRGYGGTTQATHANSIVLTRISRARVDGDAADDSPSTEISSVTNFTQIYQRTINVARSKQKSAEYGIASWKDFLIDKAMKELMMDLARLPYYGRRQVGTASVARAAGGFNTFITNNLTYQTSTAATGGTALALTRDAIDDTLQNIHTDGGDANLILTGGHAQRKINDFYEGFVQTERSESLGGVLIKKLQNPISGSYLDVVVDRNGVGSELWIVDTSKVGYYAFDPFFYEELGKTADTGAFGQVVGEYGFVVANDQHHGAVLEFSTTA